MTSSTQEVPTAITISTTYGENPIVNGGTTVETIYKGASTLTVLGPSYLTLTFYPTTTTWHTSKTTIPTATKTATQGPAKPQAQDAGSDECRPSDPDGKQKRGLSPTHDRELTDSIRRAGRSLNEPNVAVIVEQKASRSVSSPQILVSLFERA